MGRRSHMAILGVRSHISRWPGVSVVLAFLVGALIGGAGPWEKWLEGLGSSGAPNMLAVRQDNAPHSASVVVPNIPMLDFMEIGTSDFDTLLQSAAAGPQKDKVRGVSVDAMEMYLNRLPVLPHCQKVNVAVVGYRPHPAEIDVYFVVPEDIEKHNLPGWLRGCNRVGRPHDTTARILEEQGLSSLMQHRKVPVLAIDEIMEGYGGCRIKTLKLDIEGLDPDLIVAYAGYLWQNPHCHADKLLFEFNELSSKAAQDRALEAIGLVGYRYQTSSGVDAVWTYHPEGDARRWMERTMQTEGESDNGFFDESTLAAVLDEGASALR